MTPALLRVLPAIALSVPLLVTGFATATAATAAPTATHATGAVLADGGHDPAPAPSADAVPVDGPAELSGSHDEEMAGHDDEEMAGHDDEEMAGHDDEETTGHDDEEMAGHDEDSPGTDEHGSTVTEGTRPRAAVLSSFAGVNAAVLGGAAFLRRRDRRAHLLRSEADARATESPSGAGPAPTQPASRS